MTCRTLFLAHLDVEFWAFGPAVGPEFQTPWLLVPTIRRERDMAPPNSLGGTVQISKREPELIWVDGKIWVNNAPLKLHHSIHFSCFFFLPPVFFMKIPLFRISWQISWQISTIRSHHNDPTVSWLGSWRQGPQSQPLWLRDLVPWCCGSSPTAGWILLFLPCRRWRSCLEDFRIPIEIRIRDQNYSLSW